MDPNAPTNRPDTPSPEPVVPDPHRGEATPAPQEGMRPEADASLVRPLEDEPGGPLGGLLGASSAKVAEEATPGGNVAAEALLEQMGVEEEGVESGQLLGFVVATLLAVAALALVLIYLVYSPYRGATQAQASDVDQYPELQQSLVDARAKLDQSTRTGETYTVPIGRAMGLVVAEYGGTSGDSASAARTSAVPDSRQEFNTLMVNRTMGRATQRTTPVASATPAVVGPVGRGAVGAGLPANTPGGRGTTTDEEVGGDDIPDNPEAPEPRPDIE